MWVRRRCWPERPLLLAPLAAAAGGLFGFGAGACGGWIELHPDGHLFFAQHFAGNEQQAVERVAEQRSPQRAQKLELVAQGLRRPFGGARNRSSRLTAPTFGKGISGRVAKYSGSCCVTCL